ncbi:MAG: hypothetical protein B6I36_06585 [Desulfobacteraceae bacterium 4572_35.1]|nr:MAG: hypothetical protein B6I36_06585 [Desulfobacteraceae bacterium 4572_35.1]
MSRLFVFLLLFLLLGGGVGSAFAWQVHGFVDARSGMRLKQDDGQRRAILNEFRAQLEVNHSNDWSQWQLRGDVVFDEAAGEHELDLDSGHGSVDVREVNVILYPSDIIDLKLGRQILTWGTGDLLFINDMFPKDWQSFFIGRDEEYLKAPSDAVLMSIFPSFASIDIVYTPSFNSDRYISGERLSYWNPMLGRHAVRDDKMRVDERNSCGHDAEFSGRIYRDIAGYEVALYGYSGFWKNPAGYDPVGSRQKFPRLRVYGASARGGVGPGILSVEGGYYDSHSDSHGDDPFIPNSEYRLLLGYEQELRRNLSAALQYYMEYLDNYSDYTSNLPVGSVERDRSRHVLTWRLTQQAFNQNLIMSLFCYWSPSDQDSYWRPGVKYKASDALSLYLGGNLFFGSKKETFFGQFERNNNVYVGIRYSF